MRAPDHLDQKYLCPLPCLHNRILSPSTACATLARCCAIWVASYCAEMAQDAVLPLLCAFGHRHKEPPTFDFRPTNEEPLQIAK